MADRRLQVFHAVAKHLSFTKAAETLFMTQPAVTFQIKHLEAHLHTRLFDRAQGRISLTPAGRLALEYAERILALSAELETRLKESSGKVAGPLLIGASMTVGEYVLPQLIVAQIERVLYDHGCECLVSVWRDGRSGSTTPVRLSRGSGGHRPTRVVQVFRANARFAAGTVIRGI